MSESPVVNPLPEERLPNPPEGTKWYWAAAGMWALKSNGKPSSYYVRHSTPFFPDMCPERDEIQYQLRFANGLLSTTEIAIHDLLKNPDRRVFMFVNDGGFQCVGIWVHSSASKLITGVKEDRAKTNKRNRRSGKTELDSM